MTGSGITCKTPCLSSILGFGVHYLVSTALEFTFTVHDSYIWGNPYLVGFLTSILIDISLGPDASYNVLQCCGSSDQLGRRKDTVSAVSTTPALNPQVSSGPTTGTEKGNIIHAGSFATLRLACPEKGTGGLRHLLSQPRNKPALIGR